MNVYFVRHGESEFNAKELYQDGTCVLSERGHQQAELLAQRFTTIPVEIIYASPYTRALETAKHIQKVVNQEIKLHPALKEMRNPAEIVGKYYYEPTAYGIKQLIAEHSLEPTWHYADEENLHDLWERANEFVDFLTTKVPEKNVLIVSHGGVIKMMIAVMVFRSALSLEIFKRFDTAFDLYNTGITHCQRSNDEHWRVETWNDDEHLGEVIRKPRFQGIAA